jgi:hypothetical protein
LTSPGAWAKIHKTNYEFLTLIRRVGMLINKQKFTLKSMLALREAYWQKYIRKLPIVHEYYSHFNDRKKKIIDLPRSLG